MPIINSENFDQHLKVWGCANNSQDRDQNSHNQKYDRHYDQSRLTLPTFYLRIRPARRANATDRSFEEYHDSRHRRQGSVRFKLYSRSELQRYCPKQSTEEELANTIAAQITAKVKKCIQLTTRYLILP